MTVTIDTIQEKLEKIEGEIALLRAQINQWLAQQERPSAPKPIMQFVDKTKLRPLTAKSFEEMGIHGKPIDAEELQKMVITCGVKPEDNLFSRGIIEMREE